MKKVNFSQYYQSLFGSSPRCYYGKTYEIDLHCKHTVEMYTTIIGGFDVLHVSPHAQILSWLLLQHSFSCSTNDDVMGNKRCVLGSVQTLFT